jgi:cytochrome c peroxidase
VFRVIPDASAGNLDEDRLQLGFELFNEKRLSRDGSVACSTCHIGLLGGVDRQPVSFGIDGARGTLNALTIFNAALNFRQFWDGRSLTLQDQALEPIQNPAEFGHDLDGAIAVLSSIPNYVQSFASLYPDGITVANLADAIAYYETMNFTGVSSPFLRQFEEGDSVMSRRARRGQQRFVELGCASCHNGVNLGGNSYQKLGVTVDWYGDDRPASTADDGLYARTGRDEDRHVFKVPTLHNVANTGPWFHDGSVASLQQAVDQMARHQSGRYLDNNDIDDIVAFLRTTGDSQAMLGDCAVGGNYGVTLDCSVKQRTAANDSQLPEVTAPLPAADLLLVRHADAYQEAQQRVAMAPARIESEMQRIRSGEVAHYDFLQFEHIEMLRHARALSHPVASLNGSERERLLSEARRLQAEASRYELIIADFLRDHAAALNAKLNYQDLLRHFSMGADEKTTLLLGEAEDSLLRYYAVPDSDSQSRLEAATSALHELEFDEQKLLELARQVRVLTASRTSERSAQGD